VSGLDHMPLKPGPHIEKCRKGEIEDADRSCLDVLSFRAPDSIEHLCRSRRRCSVYRPGGGPIAGLLGDGARAIVFHDQLLASGSTDLLRAIVERTSVGNLSLAEKRTRGVVAVTLHYGPATSRLPLWLAMASQRGMIPQVAVIQNSRRNPNVMLSAERHAMLAACGFPFADLDLARLGELAAMRRALAILRDGGIVLIFADGQLPQTSAKRTVTCRLGGGALVLPQGAEWLARSAEVPLLPLLLRPNGDGNRVVSLNACAPGEAQSALPRLCSRSLRARERLPSGGTPRRVRCG
jgi:hypothetical protein